MTIPVAQLPVTVCDYAITIRVFLSLLPIENLNTKSEPVYSEFFIFNSQIT